MNINKKILVLCLALVVAVVSTVPATFSWYAHNAREDHGYLQYTREDLPVSGTNNTLNVKTIAVDENGDETNGDTAVTAVNFASASTAIQYYKTTINNSNGSGDVYIDLNVGNLLNHAGVKVGITSPVVNEKGFSVSKTPASHGYTRVYFQSTQAFNPYWTNNNWNITDVNDSGYDMNLRYYIGSEYTNVHMTSCSNPSNQFKDQGYGYTNTAAHIYYADIPNNATSFFFYNHYYDDNDENKEWNRTPDITDVKTPCVLYRLTGKNIEDSYKLYDTYTSNDLAALNSYYSAAQLDLGGYIDLSLKKVNENNEDNFTPDYQGTNITYTSSNTSVATVNSDGLVTAAETISGNTATATITTRIGGLCESTNAQKITCTTTITVSKYIAQMPVAQNVQVKKGEKVELYWYVKNTSSNTGNIASSIFYTD